MYIGTRCVGLNQPTYFIADIGSNHEGDLIRAYKLIDLAAEAGADAVKFQHFRAEHIVSDAGFKALGDKLGHQAGWKESVFDTFKRYEVPWSWTPELAKACKAAGVDFLSTPYDLEAVHHLDPFVPAFKVGSGDIDYSKMLWHIATKNKPVLLATGAAELAEVEQALIQLADAPDVCLMQCNTNYTGDEANFKHINLNVLNTYRQKFPDVEVLGLSDHTPGRVTVLGAVAMGARIIEKHFTDDNGRDGPDHPFAMNPETFKRMVSDTRLLEQALGDGIKRVEENEAETRIIQRRGTWGGQRLRPAHA